MKPTLKVATPALLSVILCAAPTLGAPAATKRVTWICSTNTQKWQQMPSPVVVTDNSDAMPEVRVVSKKRYQTIDGFGGCFNERGWVALRKASKPNRKQVMSALFGDEGSAFTLARLPIGASDFALDGYSLAETPNDFELRDFSIERDKKNLLPYAKAAMEVQPQLKCWGSPWSPPAWMKTNDHYSSGSLKWEPAILHSYAKYFTRWIDAYHREGINIYAITPQNEPNITSPYPSCLWTGPQLREFIANYLGPSLRENNTKVELWLGLNGDPPNGGDNFNNRLTTVLDDSKANAFVSGIGFQYDSRNQISIASELYANKKLMQSETECRGGDNSWADAQNLYSQIKRYLEGCANAYFAWNMVLDETGLSTWNWRQNALITVNQTTGAITYNGEYYVMRHFSRYVKPGAKRIMTTGVWGDKIAFVNPDGSTILVVGNSASQPYDISFAVPDGTFRATLPPQSINTFVLAPQ